MGLLCRAPANSIAVHPSGKLAFSDARDKTLRTWNLVKAYTRRLDQEGCSFSDGGNWYRNPDAGLIDLSGLYKVRLDQGMRAAAKRVDTLCRDIDSLLASTKYEVAFQTALGAENVALVFYTCTNVETCFVLGVRPPVLSQMIVLCLVQQLGSDLQRDLGLSLKWVQDSVLVMNSRYGDRAFALVHHIFNSMLSYT
ncbi:hypothetical protein SDRG_06878 [Saprolegnia diclina VS20]|uniref:Enhancer of mRNA-decapping protein 4 C-terminal domain-containing protein n=1 Tax=Saprolegnia diclina (strain VS20) TaxID=1156394 RepID=T0QP18_SAPDV|nr:hypothetical protein SDRG_06878 [Saprolegnia diclina VS20]EQC35590.1 hypothetical protein SDRG_06878 [Saprolegnia diclina VS20]|eukprot:XP_008610907.1 hypothetical protein SDRG_06878 [Saprolegnia diclina VS20]